MAENMEMDWLKYSSNYLINCSVMQPLMYALFVSYLLYLLSPAPKQREREKNE